MDYKAYLEQILDYIEFDETDWPCVLCNDLEGYLAGHEPVCDGLADLLREVREVVEV